MIKCNRFWLRQSVLAMMCGALAVGCGGTVDNEGPAVRNDQPVIGGSNATPGQWPWQAQLSVPGYSHWCGGSLLNRNWVLTAAHCAVGKSKTDFTVRLGLYQRSAPDSFVQTRGVADIQIANYNSSTGDNDIALLQLDVPVTFTSRVQPIAVDTTDVSVGTSAFVTGWGQTAPGSDSADILQQAMLPVQDTATCNNAGTLSRTVTDTMVWISRWGTGWLSRRQWRTSGHSHRL